MRVSFLTLQLMKGPIVHNNNRFAKKLLENGVEVDFVCANPIDEKVLPKVVPGVGTISLEAIRLRSAFLRLRDYIRDVRPDVILVSGYALSVACLAAAITSRQQVAVIPRSHEMTSAYLASRRSFLDRYVLKYVMRFFYRYAAAMLAVSSTVASDLEALLGVAPGAVKVLYNPTENDEMYVLAAEDPGHSWLAERSAAVVLAIGRLEPEKDHKTLLMAVKRLHLEMPVKLILLGEGSERNKLETFASEIGISDIVDFAGFKDNPFAYLARADVFVSTSVREGLSNVTIEAMALECPVVATDCVGGISEILQGDRCGIVVPVGDDAAIANALLRVLQGDRSRVKAAREQARTFSIDRSWDQFFAAYGDRLARGGRQ